MSNNPFMTLFDPFFHTVAILNSGSPNPEFVGSGVILRIEGEDYIATAAHVVDDPRGPVGIRNHCIASSSSFCTPLPFA